MATHRIASGSTKLTGTNWQQYPGGNGVFIDVDTSAGRFSSTPIYVTSIVGNTSHWATTGATSIYNPTPTGFRVYVRWVDGGPLTTEQATQYAWYINWIGMEA
jgi:hypothetical protein